MCPFREVTLFSFFLLIVPPSILTGKKAPISRGLAFAALPYHFFVVVVFFFSGRSDKIDFVWVRQPRTLIIVAYCFFFYPPSLPLLCLYFTKLSCSGCSVRSLIASLRPFKKKKERKKKVHHASWGINAPARDISSSPLLWNIGEEAFICEESRSDSFRVGKAASKRVKVRKKKESKNIVFFHLSAGQNNQPNKC